MRLDVLIKLFLYKKVRILIYCCWCSLLNWHREKVTSDKRTINKSCTESCFGTDMKWIDFAGNSIMIIADSCGRALWAQNFWFSSSTSTSNQIFYQEIPYFVFYLTSHIRIDVIYLLLRRGLSKGYSKTDSRRLKSVELVHPTVFFLFKVSA